MVVRSEQGAVLRETSFTLTANAVYQLNRTCDFLAIIALSGACEVSINEQTASTVRGGIAYKMPIGEKITSMQFREIAGAGANVTVATGDGNIFDNRASFAGNLPVVNAAFPDDSVQVDLLATDPGVLAIIAALQASNSLRSRYTSLASATYALRTNQAAAAELVSAAANTNGVLIKYAQARCLGSGAVTWLATGAGDDVICGTKGLASSSEFVQSIRDFFIPAGVRVRHHAPDTDSEMITWYQTL